MRTFWGALLDPAERPWALPVFITVWLVLMLAALFAGGDTSGW